MKLASLKSRLNKATGASSELDRLVANTLGVPERDYSYSIDACIDLIHELFPKAHWHLGRAADGVSMYATLEEGDVREEHSGPTIPLTLLNVIVAHLGRK